MTRRTAAVLLVRYAYSYYSTSNRWARPSALCQWPWNISHHGCYESESRAHFGVAYSYPDVTRASGSAINIGIPKLTGFSPTFSGPPPSPSVFPVPFRWPSLSVQVVQTTWNPFLARHRDATPRTRRLVGTSVSLAFDVAQTIRISVPKGNLDFTT